MKDKTPQAVQACHDILLWLIPQLDKFPRARRFTLGERIENGLLEVLALLVDAAYSRAKQPVLKQANLRLAVAHHLWSLAQELQVISTQRYEHGARLMDDLGRQIGGWLRSDYGRRLRNDNGHRFARKLRRFASGKTLTFERSSG